MKKPIGIKRKELFSDRKWFKSFIANLLYEKNIFTIAIFCNIGFPAKKSSWNSEQKATEGILAAKNLRNSFVSKSTLI